MDSKLTIENVRHVFEACTQKIEVIDFAGIKTAEYKEPELIEVEGIKIQAHFNKSAIAQFFANISEMLNQLPETFNEAIGGGWSFMNMCVNKDEIQWCDQHADMDKLLCLGIAAGLMKFNLPRDFWVNLPGGMPYVSFKNV